MGSEDKMFLIYDCSLGNDQDHHGKFFFPDFERLLLAQVGSQLWRRPDIEKQRTCLIHSSRLLLYFEYKLAPCEPKLFYQGWLLPWVRGRQV